MKRPPERYRDFADVTTSARVVIKIGSSSLVGEDGALNLERMAEVARCAAHWQKSSGAAVTLVSSGAIAAALPVLGFRERPRELATQQVLAAVGQPLLLAAWRDVFAELGLSAAQFLLTEDDLSCVSRRTNIRAALEPVQGLGAITIINENDAVATGEISFGDNDRLAALVAQTVGADLLLLCTDIDGLYTAAPGTPGAQRIPLVRDFSELAGISLGTVGSKVGTGGMVTKLEAAQIATEAGCATLVLQASDLPLVFSRLAEGSEHCPGTFFAASDSCRGDRRQWLKHAARAGGSLTVDEGAAKALQERNASLLFAGICQVRGIFAQGAPVDIVGLDGKLIARGFATQSSEIVRRLQGMNLQRMEDELPGALMRQVATPVAVHRDNLVLL
ncbi:glutamate 5-kinase [Dermabacteraceae bacterium TAE3-ERU5]|nr:glutamate 5-kinase [Dermabacteraceae bacterium TAE3-ERU5]